MGAETHEISRRRHDVARAHARHGARRDLDHHCRSDVPQDHRARAQSPGHCRDRRACRPARSFRAAPCAAVSGFRRCRGSTPPPTRDMARRIRRISKLFPSPFPTPTAAATFRCAASKDSTATLPRIGRLSHALDVRRLAGTGNAPSSSHSVHRNILRFSACHTSSAPATIDTE